MSVILCAVPRGKRESPGSAWVMDQGYFSHELISDFSFMKQLQNFRLSATGAEAQGEVRSIIPQCTWAQIFQYVCINFIGQVPYTALDVAALDFCWHAETTDDLYMKKDKHLLLLLCELRHWYRSSPTRTH